MTEPDPSPAPMTTPDVVDLLTDQHVRIQILFRRAETATGAARRRAFESLVRLMAVHETAEEEVVHPVARAVVPRGDAAVDRWLREERRAKRMLRDLVDMGVTHGRFDDGLRLLRDTVLAHAHNEERHEFPYLRRAVSTGRLRVLKVALRLAETVAPTRPHPETESATANLIVGPPLAVVDRVRDLIRSARQPQ